MTSALSESRHPSNWKAKLHSWYETDVSENRILAMEGLRGLAIGLVFVCHFQIVILERLAAEFHSRFYLAIAQLGGTGVDLFFVLSGMLIYRAAMKPRLQYGRFLLRRIQRIYPTFIAVLFLYVALQMTIHMGEHYAVVGFKAKATYLLMNLLLMPGMVDIPPIISAAWSLSYEFSFYLAIPILVTILKLRKWDRKARTSFWLGIGCSYLILVWLAPNLFPHYQYFDGSFVRFTLFLCGMVVEESLSSDRVPQMLSTSLQWTLLLAGVIALASLYGSELRTVGTTTHDGAEHAAIRAFFVIVVYLGMALSALKSGGILAGVFSTFPLRWTGNISYSFYLIHGFTLNIVAVLVEHLAWASRHPAITAPIVFVLAAATTFVTATVLFLAIEKPYSLKPRIVRRPFVLDPPAGRDLANSGQL